MELPPNVGKIVAAITPYIGQTMAQTSIATYCKRLGIDDKHADKGQLEQLLKQLALGLNVFIGRDKTDLVMRELRASLGSAIQ